MATGDRFDPYLQYNFEVDFGAKVSPIRFKECYGLDSEQDVILYREGGDSLSVRQIPGLIRYSNIVLKRGVANDAELWDWRKRAQSGSVERRNITIHLLDDLGQSKVHWTLLNAWPVRWKGPYFNATGNEVAIESLELTHEGISREATQSDSAGNA